MNLTLKQGDTRHAIRAVLKTVEGVVVDLAGANILFKMKDQFESLSIEKEAKLEPSGSVHVVFTKGETDVPGFYNAEFLVTYADARTETFPHTGAIKIRIESRIGGV